MLIAERMHYYRIPDICTYRPYGFDVDEDGVLWEGAPEAFYRLDTRSGAHEKFAPLELAGSAVNDAFAFQGKIYLLAMQRGCFCYDPRTGDFTRVELPGTEPNLWYGLHAAGKVLMFDRSKDGGVLIIDAPGAPVRKVTNPFGNYELAAGMVLSNNRVAIAKPDYQGFVYFDLERETFLERLDAPVEGPDEILHASDGLNARLMPYRFYDETWLDPIPTPDHGKEYGFIGANFRYGARIYYCLSTYRFRSQLDPETGELILPEGWDIGVDGRRPIRFLDRFLVFDTVTREFDYLTAPKQADGTPLLCYSLVQGDRVYITGYVIPHGADGGPSDQPGDWAVWQNVPIAGMS
ncbi:MAG: NHL repeat-containing protein [Armatimonadota bacterium]